MPARRIALVVLLCAAAIAGSQAMEVRTVQWGFDGKVVPGRINLLTLLIANPGTAPMEGLLELAAGAKFHEGAPWLEPVYLAPGTARWVQFHPWIGDGGEDFDLTWLPSNERIEIKAPEYGPPATVLLTDSDRLTLAAGAIKRFPDEIFPLTVAATDGLDAVVLDHVPHWDPPRRQAFLDWLRRGGIVHLLRGEDGGQSRFGGDLAALDQPGERFRVGAGIVVRHAVGRSGFGVAQIVAAGFAPETLAEDKSGNRPRSLGDQFFQLLAGLVKPAHAWGLIYLLLICYLLAIGPGAWLVARRRVDWRAVNLALVALVAGSALLIWMVGKRGYGEQQLLRTIGYAQALGGDEWDATQWSSCFVTDSGRYRFSHHGDANLYACPGNSESVDGSITAQGGGAFAAVLPLYSSRPFMHRGKLRGPAADLKPKRLEAAAALTALELELPDDWPLPIGEARALYRGRIHLLTGSNRTLTLAPSSEEIAGFCKTEISQPSYGYDLEQRSVQDAFARQLKPLVAYALGGVGALRHGVEGRQDPDLVSLFVLAPQAKGFQVEGEHLGHQEGIILYRIDLPVATGKKQGTAP